MKKSITRTLIAGAVIIFLSIMLIMPTYLFANSVYSTEVSVFPGISNQNTQINVNVVGFNSSGYILTVLKFNGSTYVPYGTPWSGTVPSGDWSQTFNVTLPSGTYRAKLVVQYASDKTQDFYVTTCYHEELADTGETNWTWSVPCGNIISQLYVWAGGNEWLMTSDGASPSIIVNGIGTSTLTVTEVFLDVEKIRYYYNCCAQTEPEQWVRTMPMTCWQVWINEDNMFEFIFWYPYKSNNWVRIYDMEWNMVYEVEILLNEPRIVVDLPDGMYTVKTFWIDPVNPIQEFIIGKPGPEM
jgi:hypothetical protein